MFLLWMACQEADDTKPLPDDDPTSTVDTDTTPAPTGGTGDTGETTDTTPTDPACVNLPLFALQSPRMTASPSSFDTRADGLLWFARNGIYAGTTQSNATLVYDLGGELVREDPYGNLYWLAPPDLWKVPPGGVPEVFATGLSDFPHVYQDIEVHPSGSLILADFEVSTLERRVTYIDPTGAVDVTVTSALPTPLSTQAVTWSEDGSTLWVGTDNDLWTVPADAQGAPDWSQPVQITQNADPTQIIEDLTMDACGRVILSISLRPVPLALGAGRILRFDPATGIWDTPSENIDHGYGTSPLRFGRLPGSETQVMTLSGGWSTIQLEMLRWDAGVGAPSWP